MQANLLHPSEEPAEEPAKSYLTKERLVGIKAELSYLCDDILVEAAEYAADHISAEATNRARHFLECVLAGDTKAAEALFELGQSSRYCCSGMDEGSPWAQVIHGAIFETGAIKLRRELVEAHADILKTERMADLESIIEGLRSQIVKLEERNPSAPVEVEIESIHLPGKVRCLKDGRLINKPIITLKGASKKFVVNDTNYKRIALTLGSSDTNDWIGRKINLTASVERIKGVATAVLRVAQPKLKLPSEN
jgi:hypothetical protein